LISDFRPIDLELLAAAKASYGTCTFDSDWAHWLLVEDAEKLIIACRGTEPRHAIDWQTDAASTKTYAQGVGVVHSGFFRAVTSVAWGAIPRAQAALNAGKTLYFTGHSKGGAEGVLGGLLFKQIGLYPARISLWEPARALGPEAMAAALPYLGICTRNGPDEVTEWSGLPGWMSPYPLTQLGDPNFTLLWEPYHELDAVEKAFLKAIGSS
jgi:Lipase (class 3)